ncbi:MAG: hypothetical protein HC903_30140 [Methylacidiphilales bacterium]|nr:hypothetical protein [Candidatus Methylacidiphilales bacterium]NJR15897.1 hypothetical protein [Calothrix sp. CSU_2_0]
MPRAYRTPIKPKAITSLSYPTGTLKANANALHTKPKSDRTLPSKPKTQSQFLQTLAKAPQISLTSLRRFGLLPRFLARSQGYNPSHTHRNPKSQKPGF